MTEQEKILFLHSRWLKDPILAIRSLFRVEPTDQQKSLILAAWKDQSRVAVSSCQGAGKTATLVWIMFISLLLLEDCRILITSPSYQQLTRVFSSEASKWHSKMPKVYQDQFVIRKETIALKGREGHQFASMVTASADHDENLQGGHSKNYIILADEASGIEENVFDVLLGTLSTGNGGRFIMTSNPLRSSGRFYEIFARELERWDRFYFSAYDSPVINNTHIEDMLEQYGEDSDQFRVRILGQFPRASATQFFSTDSVMQAFKHSTPKAEYCMFPLIAGVDVARFGDDHTVFVLRQGPKILCIRKFSGLDNMEVVAKLVDFNNEFRPDVINIDAIGVGAGVYDRAKQLQLPVYQVIVSQKSTDPMQYLNLRAQLYGLTRQWLENGADIPPDEHTRKQMLSVEYGNNNKMQIQMTGKKEIKSKGLPSPDIPDAISLTFAGEAYAKHTQAVQPRRVVPSNYLWV